MTSTFSLNKRCRDIAEAAALTLRPPVDDRDGLLIDLAELTQALLETRNQRSPRGGRTCAEAADDLDWPRHRRTGYKRDELASLHCQSPDAPSPSASGFSASGRMSEVGHSRRRSCARRCPVSEYLRTSAAPFAGCSQSS
jgi:hypothetical protein